MEHKKTDMKCFKCGKELHVIDLYVKTDVKEQPLVWYGNSLGCEHCYSLFTATELYKRLEKQKTRSTIACTIVFAWTIIIAAIFCIVTK